MLCTEFSPGCSVLRNLQVGYADEANIRYRLLMGRREAEIPPMTRCALTLHRYALS